EVIARGHRVVSDQPFDNGGSDMGMSPPELMLASLATCAGYYAGEYLNARGLPAGKLEVSVTAEKALHPARLVWFGIAITIADLDERTRTGILRAVKTCLIHNTLLGAPSIEI